VNANRRGRLSLTPPDHPNDRRLRLSAYRPSPPFGLGKKDDAGGNGFPTRPNPDQRHTVSVSGITRQRCRLSLHLVVGLHECDAMAVHMSLELTETLAVEGTDVPPPALNDLLTLASWVAVRWRELDEQARQALVRKIQQMASDLGRQAQGNGWETPGSGDEPEVINRLILLTPREIQVLEAITDGHSTAKIASLLGISSATVRSHVKSLLAKLGLHSRVEAVSLILRSDAVSTGSETA
jgi:DNA-binding CsgD family transcriptional regulator